MARHKRRSTLGSILLIVGSCLFATIVFTFAYLQFEAWAREQPRELSSDQVVWFQVPNMTALPSPTVTPLPSSTPTPTPTPGPPVYIEIPKIGVRRTIVPVGLVFQDGQLEWNAESLFATRSRRDLVGHLEGSANPGEPGNVILIGHNYNQGAYNWLGVFYAIHRLRKGDLVLLLNEQSVLYTYQVVRVEKVPLRSEKSAMKHATYLSPTVDETLTLVTCGGANLAPFPSRIYVTAKHLED